jgi:hypothetical protein
MRKYSEGVYEAGQNILHLWYPHAIQLADEATIEEFFDESLREWIAPCPTPPYLLVNYANVLMRPDMAESYARNIQRLKGRILGTYRYGIDPDAHGLFTSVAVRLGNLRITEPAHIFESEKAARAAIAEARALAGSK